MVCLIVSLILNELIILHIRLSNFIINFFDLIEWKKLKKRILLNYKKQRDIDHILDKFSNKS